MKIVKIGLRFWLTITSILSFLIGWALFSHAGKPAPLFPAQTTSSVIQQPVLAPVPSIDDLLTNPGTHTLNLQPLPSLSDNTARAFLPRMRTMGS